MLLAPNRLQSCDLRMVYGVLGGGGGHIPGASTGDHYIYIRAIWKRVLVGVFFLSCGFEREWGES